jgi:hypothetical protein
VGDMLGAIPHGQGWGMHKARLVTHTMEWDEEIICGGLMGCIQGGSGKELQEGLLQGEKRKPELKGK